jgi:hypothetical protein
VFVYLFVVGSDCYFVRKAGVVNNALFGPTPGSPSCSEQQQLLAKVMVAARLNGEGR